jgi:Ras-related protein Rab-11B
MYETSFDYTFKVIIAGDSGVGKTNIALQVDLGVFSPQSKTTIGAELRVKTIEVDGKLAKVQI